MPKRSAFIQIPLIILTTLVITTIILFTSKAAKQKFSLVPRASACYETQFAGAGDTDCSSSVAVGKCSHNPDLGWFRCGDNKRWMGPCGSQTECEANSTNKPPEVSPPPSGGNNTGDWCCAGTCAKASDKDLFNQQYGTEGKAHWLAEAEKNLNQTPGSCSNGAKVSPPPTGGGNTSCDGGYDWDSAIAGCSGASKFDCACKKLVSGGTQCSSPGTPSGNNICVGNKWDCSWGCYVPKPQPTATPTPTIKPQAPSSKAYTVTVTINAKITNCEGKQITDLGISDSSATHKRYVTTASGEKVSTSTTKSLTFTVPNDSTYYVPAYAWMNVQNISDGKGFSVQGDDLSPILINRTSFTGNKTYTILKNCGQSSPPPTSSKTVSGIIKINGTLPESCNKDNPYKFKVIQGKGINHKDYSQIPNEWSIDLMDTYEQYVWAQIQTCNSPLTSTSANVTPGQKNVVLTFDASPLLPSTPTTKTTATFTVTGTLLNRSQYPSLEVSLSLIAGLNNSNCTNAVSFQNNINESNQFTTTLTVEQNASCNLASLLPNYEAEGYPCDLMAHDVTNDYFFPLGGCGKNNNWYIKSGVPIDMHNVSLPPKNQETATGAISGTFDYSGLDGITAAELPSDWVITISGKKSTDSTWQTLLDDIPLTSTTWSIPNLSSGVQYDIAAVIWPKNAKAPRNIITNSPNQTAKVLSGTITLPFVFHKLTQVTLTPILHLTNCAQFTQYNVGAWDGPYGGETQAGYPIGIPLPISGIGKPLLINIKQVSGRKDFDLAAYLKMASSIFSIIETPVVMSEKISIYDSTKSEINLKIDFTCP